MKTRQSLLSKREYDRERRRTLRKTRQGNECNKNSVKKAKRTMKISTLLLEDQLKREHQKVITIRNMMIHLKALLESSQEQLFFQESLIENQLIIDEEVLAADDNDDFNMTDQASLKCSEFLNTRLEDPSLCEKFCGLEKDVFDDIMKICGKTVEHTTFRGSPRKRSSNSSKISIEHMIFVTLMFLAHYPTLAYISSILGIHERDVTKILKRCTCAMAVGIGKGNRMAN